MRQNSRTVYLFGHTLDHFPTTKLPSYQQVFQRFYYIHTIDQQRLNENSRTKESSKLKESARLTAVELIDIWRNRANLPTKDENEVSKMIINYYNEWSCLKMNEHHILKGKQYNKAIADKDERALLKSQNQEEKKKNFQSNFDNLFDIAHKNAFEKVSVQEDIDFYLLQKKPGRPGSISQSIDRSYSILLDCSLSDIENEMDCN